MGSHEFIEEVAELMAADGKAAIKIGNANLPANLTRNEHVFLEAYLLG